MKSTIPYRFSESQFRRYAPFIGAALQAWPAESRIALQNGQPSGFIGPCRDARAAKLKYGYRHPDIDETLFRLHGKELAVYERDGEVVLGPRPKRGCKALAVAIPVQDTGERFEVTGAEGVEWVCRLINSDALRPIPCFVWRPTMTLSLEGVCLLHPHNLFQELPDSPGVYQIT